MSTDSNASRISGWMRLWILVAVLLGAGAIVYGFSTIPKESQITAMHEAMLSLLTHDLAEKQAGRGQTDPNNPYVGTKLTVEELKRRILEENHTYADAIHHLPTKQTAQAMTLGITWLFSVLGLYIVGLLVGWTVRGFRPDVSP